MNHGGQTQRVVVEWHVWYADGTHYQGVSGDQATWDAMPQHGIQWLLLLMSDGSRQNFCGRDLFWFQDGIFANDNDRDALLRRFPWVKFGSWMPTDKFYSEITAEAERIGKQWWEKFYGDKSRPDR